MAPNTFSIHFTIRNERVGKGGHVPIYGRVILNKESLKFSLGHKISPSEWLTDKERVKPSSKSAALVNETIEAFSSRVYQAYSKVIASNEPVTIDSLKDALYGKEKVKTHTLIQTAIEHNDHFKSMLGIKYSKGSYKNYKSTLKYLIEFVPQFSRKKDIPLSSANYQFCEAFFTYLTTQKTCKVNGANKQIQRLKKIINYAIRQGYIPNSPMAAFSIEFTPVNKIALTLEELKRIQGLNLQRTVLQNVRDIFLFQCYTGLSYSDIKLLSVANIHPGEDGNYWIKMSRQKTQIAFSVPLLSVATSILNRYIADLSEGKALLPVLSNQKMNANLKLIQELAGIGKNLTTHLARHTFATTVTLSNGVPIETVSRMLGHTKLSTTQVYAKVLDNKIAEDMGKIRDKFNGDSGIK